MPVTVKLHHQQVKRQMRVDIAEGENNAMGFVVREAKANAPVKTGHLRGSIEQFAEATPSKPMAAVGVGADYGKEVDQGTAHMAGKFFWTRALLAARSRFPSFFKK